MSYNNNNNISNNNKAFIERVNRLIHSQNMN